MSARLSGSTAAHPLAGRSQRCQPFLERRTADMVISFNWRWEEDGFISPGAERAATTVSIMKGVAVVEAWGAKRRNLHVHHSAISSAIYCKHFHLNL